MIYIKGWGVFFEVKIIWQPEELEAISGQGLDQEKDKKLSVRVRVPEKGEQVDRGGVDTKCKRRIGIAKQASFPCRPESSPAEFTQWKLPSLMQLRWEVRSTGKPRPWGRALPSCHHGRRSRHSSDMEWVLPCTFSSHRYLQASCIPTTDTIS